MFKPNTTVACVVICQNRYLLVEEIDEGKRVYNQPAGHLEKGESLLAAAHRELWEETGLKLQAQYLLGIYQNEVPNKTIQYLRFCYVIELEGECPATAPQDSDIIAAHWLSLAEIEQRVDQMRSPLVMQCIKDHIKGEKIPLDSIKSYL